MKRWLWIGAAVAVVALVAGLVAVISGGSSGGGGIGVYQAWVRSTAASQTNAAVYATVKNGDDRQNAVVGAQVPSSTAS